MKTRGDFPLSDMDAQTITGGILLNQQELIDELLKKHDHFDDEKSDQQ